MNSIFITDSYVYDYLKCVFLESLIVLIVLHIKITACNNTICLSLFQCSYIIGVDVPGHITVRHQLTVDIATDLGVPPSVVDVDDADHVPLKKSKNTFRKREDEKSKQKQTNSYAAMHQII